MTWVNSKGMESFRKHYSGMDRGDFKRFNIVGADTKYYLMALAFVEVKINPFKMIFSYLFIQNGNSML